MSDDPAGKAEAPQEELEVEPVRQKADWVEALGGISLGSIVLGGVTLAVIAGATPTRTMGATRSAHLEWQRRRVQIEAALQEEEAGEPTQGATEDDG
jgi:hypothetical protein